MIENAEAEQPADDRQRGSDGAAQDAEDTEDAPFDIDRFLLPRTEDSQAGWENEVTDETEASNSAEGPISLLSDTSLKSE